MKAVMLFPFLLAAFCSGAQTAVQPVASGDYWRIDTYQNRLPELVTKATFPALIRFTNGYVAVRQFYVNRLTAENEIVWQVGAANNVSNYVVEWSRDARQFERLALVNIDRVEGGRYVIKHLFQNNQLVYYRIGIVTAAGTVAYTPAVQVMDEEHSTKIYPTLVKGGSFFVQTGQPYEVLQVLSSTSQRVYEKGINGQTGTIPVLLPSLLPKGIYFVRLLNTNGPQHVQRVMVE